MPVIKNIHDNIKNGKKNNVALIFPYTEKYNNNQTIKLEIKLKNAVPKLENTNISRGKTTFFTRFPFCKMIVGALETTSENKLNIIIPAKSTSANSSFEPLPPPPHLALKTTLNTNV
nr:hypothetical protein [Plesiomonas shigelloides]